MLSGVLGANLTLTAFDLQNNSIGDKGAQAHSEALETNMALTTLYLWRDSSEHGAGSNVADQKLSHNKIKPCWL